LSGGQVLGASEIRWLGQAHGHASQRQSCRRGPIWSLTVFSRLASSRERAPTAQYLRSFRWSFRECAIASGGPSEPFQRSISFFLLGPADPYRRLDQAYLAIVVGALASC